MPTQLAACRSLRKKLMSMPSSAMSTSAVRLLIPGVPLSVSRTREGDIKIGARVPVAALADDLAAGDLEGRLQAGKFVASVVVTLPRRHPEPQGHRG